jgi:hypothetical protein
MQMQTLLMPIQRLLKPEIGAHTGARGALKAKVSVLTMSCSMMSRTSTTILTEHS